MFGVFVFDIGTFVNGRMVVGESVVETFETKVVKIVRGVIVVWIGVVVVCSRVVEGGSVVVGVKLGKDVVWPVVVVFTLSLVVIVSVVIVV